jgi:transcriptional regulator of arginine metabolism
MKSSRQKKILEIISRHHVETQDDLIDHLLVEGFSVTQATVSRDIRELQLTKVLSSKGSYRYIAPKKEDIGAGAKINNALVDSIIGVEYAQNMVVIHTFPGLAQAVGAGVDN